MSPGLNLINEVENSSPVFQVSMFTSNSCMKYVSLKGA